MPLLYVHEKSHLDIVREPILSQSTEWTSGSFGLDVMLIEIRAGESLSNIGCSELNGGSG